MKHGTLAPVAFALATLCVYASTMYPSAAGGDATEFAFIACDFPAVPHPPGYPTFALLTAFASRAFRAMRFGGPAWGSNFASASCGAAASGVLYAAIRDAVGGRREGSTTIATHAAAALGAGLFACGKNTWTNTIQSEVFGLNNLFVAAAVYFTVAFARDNAVAPPPDRSAAAFKHALKGAFTCGLAMSNQHTFALVGTPLATWVLLRGLFAGAKSLRSPSRLLAVLSVPFLGLTPYAYLVLASGTRPGWRNGRNTPRGGNTPGAWGETRSRDGFWTHVTRAEYGTFTLFSGEGSRDHRARLGITRYARNLHDDTGGIAPWLMLAAVIGGVSAWARERRRRRRRRRRNEKNASDATTETRELALAGSCHGLAPVVVAYALYTVGFQLLANLPIEKDLYAGVSRRFWMQSDVLAGFVAGAGAAFATSRTIALLALGGDGRGRGAMRNDANANRRRAFFEFAALGIVLALLCSRVVADYRAMDQSGNAYYERFGREMLRPLPKGARLIVRGDLITNSARYVQRCLGYRKDVQMVDMAMLTYKWFVKTQSGNFKSFHWPGTHYHPNEPPHGFSMRALLDLNYHKDSSAIFLAGGWHDDDPSTVGHYDTMPFGIADEIVKLPAAGGAATRGLPFKSLKKFYKRRAKALPNMTFSDGGGGNFASRAMSRHVLPRFGGDREVSLAEKYPEGTWERVVMTDYHGARHKLAHALLSWGIAAADVATRESGVDDASSSSASKAKDDRVYAFETSAAIIEACVSEHPPPVPSFYYRNLGICRQRAWGERREKTEHHAKMVTAFKAYLAAVDAEGGEREGGYDAIAGIVLEAERGSMVA